MAGRLSIASMAAAGALALLATPAFATEPDRDCTRETAVRPAAAMMLHETVDTIFDRVAARAAEDPAGELTSMEVVMVRIVDGKPVMACVDTKEAAKRFLAATADKLAAKSAQEK
jgi:hypothetical protein